MPETIGERAVKAIRERAEENGTKLYRELRKIDAFPRSFTAWEKKGYNPSAYTLGQMVLAGYDVMWILTGVKSDG